jgi:hypothetical protein
MTQVIGVNNNDRSAGFYVDKANVTHGFTFGLSSTGRLSTFRAQRSTSFLA